jgi:hypothetical protein
MTAHYSALKKIFKECEINITKVTHAARGFSARYATFMASPESETKAHGLWSADAFRACYQTQLPIQTLRALAGFHAIEGIYLFGYRTYNGLICLFIAPGDYFIPRSSIEPPPHLQERVFPWVEEEILALGEREKKGPQYRDMALRSFLNLLLWLRLVILQDAPFHIEIARQSYLWTVEPFSSVEFLEWARRAREEVCIREFARNLIIFNLQHFSGFPSGKEVRREPQGPTGSVG